jgi:Carboxypeptidase regulatory-like domain
MVIQGRGVFRRLFARSAVVLLFTCLLASGDVVRAQVQTGTVTGLVKDQSSAITPGVSVTLTSPVALPGGPVTTVTDTEGRYRFPEVPPGVYTVTVMLDGFATYVEKDVAVAVAGTVELDVALKPSQVSETITVTGQAPVVDPTKVAVTASVPADLVVFAPAIHSGLNDLQKWAPGTSPTAPGDENQYMSVMGSPGFETSWMMDGAMTNDPASGDIFTAGDPDTLLELQTTALGASAEYQIAQGGVMNAVLKSGTNLFKFDGETSWAPDALTSKPIVLPCATCPGGGDTGFTNIKTYTAGAHAGGPIVKDKLWFYGGYGTWEQFQGQPGTNPATDSGSHRNWITTKGTWHISDSSNFTGTYYDSPYQLGGVPTASVLYAATSISPGHSHVYAAEYEKTLSDSTYFVIRSSGWWQKSSSSPLDGNLTASPIMDLVTGITSQGVTSIRDYDSGRNAQAFKLDHYFHIGPTEHDLKGGVQFEQSWYNNFSAVPGGVEFMESKGLPDEASYQGPTEDGATDTQKGAWAEDQIRAGRLTINAGLRFDSLNAVSPSEPVINTLLQNTGATVNGLGNLFTWNTWSPRVGLNLKLTDDGKTILRGIFGRYYRTILLNDYATLHPGVATVTLDKYNPVDGLYDSLISVTNPTANQTIDRNIKPPYTNQFSVGIDRELIPTVAVTASYVHKYSGDTIGWKDIGGVYGSQNVVLANGQTLTVEPLLNSPSQRLFERTNGPGYFDQYDGLITSLNKRFSQRWQADVQYTYSRAYGLQTGSNSSFSSPTGQDPNDLINLTGRLMPQDRPQMLRAEGSYLIPKIELSVGTTIEEISGQALLPTALITLPQGARAVAIAPPGTYRLPWVNLVNVQFDKTILKTGDHRLMLTAQIFNLLQSTAAESVTSTNYFASTFLAPATWLPARYLKIGAKFNF